MFVAAEGHRRADDVLEVPALQEGRDGLGHRDGHYGVVREPGIPAKQREVFRLVAPVELIGRADHYDKSESERVRLAGDNWINGKDLYKSFSS